MLGSSGIGLGSSTSPFGSPFGNSSNTGPGGANAAGPYGGQGQVLGAGSPLMLGAGTGNLAYQYYGNPMYQGWPGNFGRPVGGWGVPLYQGANFGTAGSAGSTFGSSTGLGGTGSANINSPMGGAFPGATGGRRPAVVTTVVFPVRPTLPVQLQADLRNLFARSTTLAPTSEVQVYLDGRAVVLRGAVADDRERRVAEAMVRLTPGVREVRNELQVQVPLPAPKPVRD